MTDKSLAYWVGRLEEVDRAIELLQRFKSKPMRVRLAQAKQLRREATTNIAKLAGLGRGND